MCANRVQTLRSSAPGVLPQAGTRQPGELWLNFADSALGFIDTTQTAQKLLAVRLFVTTTTYAVGDFIVYAGNLYQAVAPSTAGAFNAANWSKIGTAQDLSQYLLLAGGTLTGALNLPATAPTVATQATNKSYVDAGDATATALANTKLPLAGGTLTGALNGVTANFSGVATAADPPAADSSSKLVTTHWYAQQQPIAKDNSNRIINGEMRIDQRNNGAAGTATAFTIDRWNYVTNQVGRLQWNRTSGPGPAAIGFPYCLNIDTVSAATPGVNDAFYLQQTIEADMVADFRWGTPNAQPVTLSFWVNSNQSLTLGGALVNQPGPPNRGYPFTFLVAPGWSQVVITIPGDTAGTWVMQGNAGGVALRFDLGGGSNNRAPANAWASGNLVSATGAGSMVPIAGAIFQLTGVKLEIGGVASLFPRQTTARSLLDCQRYYQTGVLYYISGVAIPAGAPIAYSSLCPVPMRAAPTMTALANVGSNVTTMVLGSNNLAFWIGGNAVAAAPVNINITFGASAEL